MQITLDTYNISGLTGTLGYTVYNADHTVFQARTTAGITEFPAGSGAYQAEEDAATLAGRLVIWDTGGATPLYAQEFFPVSLTETVGAVITRSLRTLAHEAQQRYPKGDYALWQQFLREAWREFCHRCPWVYAREFTFQLVDGQRVYELPYDFRRMRDDGVVLQTANLKILSLTEEETLAGSAGWDSEEGEPESYYYPDATHLAFYPRPDGVITSATMKYYAEAPSEISLDTGLPLPTVYERGLIGYAIAQMAETAGEDERDDRRAQREIKYFERAVADYTADVSLRVEADTAITPADTMAQPNTDVATDTGTVEDI